MAGLDLYALFKTTYVLTARAPSLSVPCYQAAAMRKKRHRMEQSAISRRKNTTVPSQCAVPSYSSSLDKEIAKLEIGSNRRNKVVLPSQPSIPSSSSLDNVAAPKVGAGNRRNTVEQQPTERDRFKVSD